MFRVNLINVSNFFLELMVYGLGSLISSVGLALRPFSMTFDCWSF